MEDKKQEKINEQEKNQKQKQGVIELIEDSLGGVSGGFDVKMTNVDDYTHFDDNNGT